MKHKLKVAILDLNNGEANLSIGYLQTLIKNCNAQYAGQELEYSIYDVRQKDEIPSMHYDIYLSSGGPGSPYDGEHSIWETEYFKWVDRVWNHNETHDPHEQKYVFFICHSFQMMVRHFKLAKVTKRHSMSFGVMPTHKTEAGYEETLFKKLSDPFYVADFRNWQAVEPDLRVFDELGARTLCLEKIRPHLDFERALMAIRISDAMIGTQFHPEADASGMVVHFQKPDKKQHIFEHHGEEKYHQILEHLGDPDKINATYQAVLPTFMKESILLKAGFAKEMILH
jgi:GMP synthase-like glutamine amidotransferase